jgi:hypothetical protein
MTNSFLASLFFLSAFSLYAHSQDPEEKKAPFPERRPNWALHWSYMPIAASGSNMEILGISRTSGFELEAMAEPEFLQVLGVIGAGGTFNTYSTATKDFGIHSFGVRARYYLYLSKHQAIVPTAYYSYDFLTYNYNTETGNFPVTGFGFGAFLNLTKAEYLAAKDFFHRYGVARSFLTFEVAAVNGADKQVSLGGRSYKLGLRLEYN